MDFLKDPQKIIDRMWMQIDYALGKDVKTGFQMNVNALDKSNTPDQAAKKIQQGGIVNTISNEKVLQAIESKGANPDWLNIANIMLMYLDDMSGGKNFGGGSEGTSESGRAVLARTQQGQLMAAPFLDNLSRWKQAAWENALWWLCEYEDAEDVIKVQGGALTPQMIELLKQNGIFTPSKKDDGTGYVNINQDELTYLKDADFELVVTETELSETDKHAKRAMMLEEEKTNPMLATMPEWFELKLEYMNITGEMKQKLILGMQKRMQAEAAKAQRAEAREDAKLNIDKAKVLAGLQPKPVIKDNSTKNKPEKNEK
jgi:hypothetical protein